MRSRQFNSRCGRSHQRGAVLGIALLVLTTLTLLAVFASQQSRSRGLSIGVVQQREVAFQSAESALHAAERLISRTDLYAPCANDRCRIYGNVQPFGNSEFITLAWWARHGWAYTESNRWLPATDVNTNGYSAFVIERIADVPDVLSIAPDGGASGQTYYRATAIARPAPGVAPVIVQSTFSVPFD